MNEKEVVIVGSGPIKDDAGLHGKDIGYVYGGYNTIISVDYDSLHDGWVKITNPPTWKETGKVGWIKASRIAIVAPDKFIYRVEVDKQTGEMTWALVG